MTLTLIALTGIFVGFLCLMIGFFLEEAGGSRPVDVRRDRRPRAYKKKTIVPRQKAA